jgi:hypothetical protein
MTDKIAYDRRTGDYEQLVDYSEFERAFQNLWADYFSQPADFTVQTSNHGWKNNSGVFEKTYDDGQSALQEVLSGIHNFSLEAEFRDSVCFLTLYSHDNPDGANFEFYLED